MDNISEIISLLLHLHCSSLH